jgi:NAD(P)H dehydrogenase (quinone)
MESDVVAVTGATGALGGRIARRLAERGIPQRLVVRDGTRVPRLDGAEVASADYADGDAMRAALAGVRTLLLVSATETQGRTAVHRAAIDAAVDAGVNRIVYTSFFGASPTATFTFARHHWDTEQMLRERGIRHTILRDNLYLDVLPMFVGADRILRGPAGEGRVAAVARDDIASAAVAVLADGSGMAEAGPHDGRTYDLTGPQALTLHEVTHELSAASGATVTYHPETVDEAYASRAHYGAPAWEVEGWVTTYAAIATGELAGVTDHVQQLTGHAPMSFAEYLQANPGALAHLRG